MRKPRDYDAELEALEARAQQLKSRKLVQLGELVVSTGADALTIEELAGALLALASTTDAQRREAWRKRGAAFFLGRNKAAASGTHQNANGDSPQPAGDQPGQGPAGAA